ncbi:TonB family protein [Pedobacter metabolipauper]|uniref:TonB family protein n=1 Tax=Pedobacter metabolipauper TaxID=425513 RepID=A0A4V3D185_9SPHI|nr:TonB family protein [Pedobacter metabolipauper]TDQ09717.1 TonB family protein [Pedobacter metabolipauper]
MSKILTLIFLLSGFVLKAEPELKGGLESFINANKIYPQYSLRNCIDGTVTIGFKLNKNGKVYFSVIRSGVGTDLDDEALRLVRMSSGQWIVPEDHDTATVIIAPIKFTISGQDCQGKSRQEINLAIESYRANKGSTDAVLNFYRNKGTATYTRAEELRILALKQSLGYDEAYFKERIEDGLKKIQQKDQQGACEDFRFVKNMGSNLADEMLAKYCN